MTRRELADWLSRAVAKRRLERIWEPPPEHQVPFADLSSEDQQPWLDTADAVLEYLHDDSAIARLQSLGADWIRYTMQLSHDELWRDEMRQAVVIEMRQEVERLAKECGLDAS